MSVDTDAPVEMGKKRKLDTALPGAEDVGDGHKHVSGFHKKPKKPNGNPGPYPMRGSRSRRLPKNAVNPIKERIRDIKRLLGHAGSMPADRRVELERELSVLQSDLEIALAENHTQKMIGRYHMVRFFEKQKAMRRLKQVQKRVDAATTPEDTAMAKQDLHIAEVDSNYATYFPLDLPYVALFPRKKDDAGQAKQDNESIEEGVRGDTEMWRIVEECTANSNLEDLRSGLLTKDRKLATQMGTSGLDEEHSLDKPAATPAAKGNIKDGIDMHDTVMGDGSSDGGFFE